MPRNHYFQTHFPAAAKQQSNDQAELANVIWHAFTKYTGLQKFFSFSVLPPAPGSSEQMSNKIK